MLLRAAIKRGLEAARVNLRPGLLLWMVALAVVAAYYLPGGARGGLDSLGAFKQRWGYGFAAVSTALWGGLIPVLLMRVFIRDATRRPVTSGSTLLFLILFWALKGAEVNFLYEILARTFGADADLRTIIIKVSLDQFVYGPFWAVPTLALAYLWKDQGYSFRRLAGALDRRFYETTALPMLLANWGVWLPTAAAIYALPLSLQLPLQNLVLCLWSLMLATMTSRRSPITTMVAVAITDQQLRTPSSL